MITPNRLGNFVGLLLILASIVLLFFVVRTAQAHDPEDVSITGVASPDCRQPDESWSVEWTLSVSPDAPAEFAITDTNVNVRWSNGGNPVDPGESITTGVNYAASVQSAQLIVTHDNDVHEAQSFASAVVERPELCATPTPTSTPEPTATPEPTSTATPLATLEPLDLCQNIEGTQSSIPDGLEWDLFQCVAPTAEPAAPTPIVVTNVITPPATGSAGLK